MHNFSLFWILKHITFTNCFLLMKKEKAKFNAKTYNYFERIILIWNRKGYIFPFFFTIQRLINKSNNQTKSKKKRKKERDEIGKTYTKGASFGAFFTLNTINPHYITPCIYLNIVILGRCSYPYFCIIKPTQKKKENQN